VANLAKGSASSADDAFGASKLRLEFWKIDRLVPSPRNARTHSDAQVAEIAGSIRAFGFSNPILVGEDRDVVAGHGRLAAARVLGLIEVPVIVLGDLSEIQRRQLMLADNRIAMNAGWDLEMLHLELRDLSAMGADLSVLGFTEHELAKALQPGASGLTDENEIPSVSDKAVSIAGDVWCLGNHRVICGDSTNPTIVAAVLGRHKPMLMVTDPPYGVNYDPEWRHERELNKSNRTGKVQNDERADWAAAWKLFPGNIAYVWHAALQTPVFAESLQREGFSLRAQIIWAKERLVIGRGDYHWQHEPCWYAVRSKGHWTGDRKQTTLWTIPSSGQDTDTIHGTQKPVECMRRPMLNNSKAEDLIYEPFLGSGTTLIAAESVGRVCLAIEIDPLYVDLAVRRWQAFTGKNAMLEASGQAFEAIAAQRVQSVAGNEPTRLNSTQGLAASNPEGG
jgi:DNA modification methylase